METRDEKLLRMLSPEQKALADELMEKGYRRVSRKFGHVARVDRRDWLFVDQMLSLRSHLSGMAEHYCRVFSKDKVVLGENSLTALAVPTHGFGEISGDPIVEETWKVIEAALHAWIQQGKET
jgi:hypothetical protein